MRTCCVILAISVILALISISEAIVAKKFCKEMEQTVLEVSEKIKSDTVNKTDIENVNKVWTENKTAVFTFANHNMFKEYEDCISDMYYCCRFELKDKLYYTSYKLLEVNKRMEEAVQFNIANIF